LSFAGLPQKDAFLRSYSYFDRDVLSNAFHSPTFSIIDDLYQSHHEIFDEANNRKFIDKMCYTDLNLFMPSLNLAYSDRASMAASTEIRVPFVDKEIVDLAFKLDPRLKINNGTQKYILKKVAEKWLPHEIIYRPKSSFTLPLRSWIFNDLGGLVDDYLLSDSGLAGRNLFKKAFLENIIREFRLGLKDNAQIIWHLLTLEQWFKNRN